MQPFTISFKIRHLFPNLKQMYLTGSHNFKILLMVDGQNIKLDAFFSLGVSIYCEHRWTKELHSYINIKIIFFFILQYLYIYIGLQQSLSTVQNEHVQSIVSVFVFDVFDFIYPLPHSNLVPDHRTTFLWFNFNSIVRVKNVCFLIISTEWSFINEICQCPDSLSHTLWWGDDKSFAKFGTAPAFITNLVWLLVPRAIYARAHAVLNFNKSQCILKWLDFFF